MKEMKLPVCFGLDLEPSGWCTSCRPALRPTCTWAAGRGVDVVRRWRFDFGCVLKGLRCTGCWLVGKNEDCESVMYWWCRTWIVVCKSLWCWVRERCSYGFVLMVVGWLHVWVWWEMLVRPYEYLWSGVWGLGRVNPGLVVDWGAGFDWSSMKVWMIAWFYCRFMNRLWKNCYEIWGFDCRFECWKIMSCDEFRPWLCVWMWISAPLQMDCSFLFIASMLGFRVC